MKITKLSVIGISLMSLVACGETATEAAPTEKTCKTMNDVCLFSVSFGGILVHRFICK